ncbi:MAG TPA: BamA/TamA family outer membrane protein [Acidobacteriota bacterium]|nr:BamA/TamA family outer membrane protein [Acidobacteriota bacterium]
MKRFVPVALAGMLLTVAFSLARADDRATLRWIRSKPPIDSIAVEGNAYFKDSEIRKRMYSRAGNLWRVIRGDRRYRVQRETYRRDTLEVKYLYLSNGFLAVHVSESFEVLGLDSAALVRVVIDEGRQFRYGPKTVTGDAAHNFMFYCQKIADRLKDGEPINSFDLRQAVFDMKTHLANNGYPYARVAYDLDTTSPGELTPIAFTLEPDSLVRFGEVTVEGTEEFPEYTARRELKIRPGSLYRREDILGSQRRLFESGYFSTLQLKMAQNTADRLRPDFVLRVRERKSRFMTFRTGAGQSPVRDLIWDVSAGFGKRNFLGSRRYELLADYSFSVGTDSRLITHRYRLRFTEPWFLGFRMPLSLTFEVQPRKKDATNNFDKRAWAVSASTRMRFGEKLLAGLGIEFQYVKISGVPEAQILTLKKLTENRERRKIFAQIRRDSRDDLFIPRRGVVADLSAQFFGGFLGGSENFVKVQAAWSRYGVFWPGWIAATRIMGSRSQAFGESDEVPLDEVIYLGGANTIRAFAENQLGRFTVADLPVGPRYTFVFNQEFRWRTLQVFKVIPVLSSLMRSFPLWQSVFFDMGNGFRSRREMSFNNMAFSYGTGIQIVSPAGPIRVDYARRIPNESFGFDERWHFTILYAF